MWDWNVNLASEFQKSGHFRHIEINLNVIILFSFPCFWSTYAARAETSNNRCSSFCCCLYSTSRLRLRHIGQRADPTYWIHKNNKPIKIFDMDNSITSPGVTISLILLCVLENIQWNHKNVPCSLHSRDWSLLGSLVGTVRWTWKCTLQAISCVLTIVLWSPHRGGHRL